MMLSDGMWPRGYLVILTLVGGTAALVSVLPSLGTSAGATSPWPTLLLLLGLAGAALLGSALATRAALRGDLLGALRDE